MNTVFKTIAIVIFTIGTLSIADWILFYERNKKHYPVFSDLRDAYIGHFPEWLQPLYMGKPATATIILIVALASSGFIFNQYKTRVYKGLAVASFVFSLWYLFTIM